MKKFTLITLFSLSVVSLFSQQTLVKIDGDDVVPTSGQCFPSVFSTDNSQVYLCVTDDVSYWYEPNTGANRTVSSSSLAGKRGKLIRSQYLSGTAFWYMGNVSTIGYKDLSISAWHSGAVSGSSNYEPARNWILEYCIGNALLLEDAAVWHEAMTYSISENIWTETAFSLPAECANQPAISFRWKNNGDKVGIRGGASNTNGWSWIDEIEVKGTTDGNSLNKTQLDVKLEVRDNKLIISGIDGRFEILNLNGALITSDIVKNMAIVEVAVSGIYLVKVESNEGVAVKKISFK
ncbi:MAG: T9SS type A sorting domain-containing protein [Bacteroidales bacterium]